MSSRKSYLVYFSVVLAMICWSFSFVWYKQVFPYFQPITVIVLRLVIAVPLLFLLSLAARQLEHIQKGHLKWFLFLGFFEPFLYFIGECYGMRLVSATLGSIIIALIPLLVPIPARYLFRERFTLGNYIGLFISLAGVLVVISGENSGGRVSPAGVMLMLLATLAAVGHSIFVRKLSEFYGSFTIVTYQSTFGLIYFLPLFAVTEMRGFFNTAHPPEAFIPIVKLAVFASIVAFLLFVYSIKNLGMARTNVFVNLIPVFTAIFSFLVLGESFGVVKIAGVAVVIAGLIFSQLYRLRR